MNEDTRRLRDRYARAIQEVYPGDWHDSDDATECEPCLRKAMAALTVRDEEMERLRAELAEANAHRERLADFQVATIERNQELLAERDALKATLEHAKGLHPRDDSNPPGPWCPTCIGHWPCQTIRALEGSTP